MEQRRPLTFDLARAALWLDHDLGEEHGVARGGAWRPERSGLAALLMADERPVRPIDVSRTLGLSTATTSKLLNRLQTDSLIEHVDAESQDARAVWVETTELGRRLLTTCDERLVEVAPRILPTIDARAGMTDGDDTRGGPPASATTVAPALRALLQVLQIATDAVRPVIAGLDVLDPSDPRAVVVLTKILIDGPVRVGSVASLVSRSRPAAKVLLTELEHAGLVVRQVDPADRRASVVDLTPVGRSITNGIVAATFRAADRLEPALADLALDLRQPRPV